MEFITENQAGLWTIIGAAVTIATVIVRWTKTKKDDAILDRILQVINVFKKPNKDA